MQTFLNVATGFSSAKTNRNLQKYHTTIILKESKTATELSQQT